MDSGFFTPDLHWQEFSFPETTPSRFALDSVGDKRSGVELQKIMISFKVSDLESYVKKLETKGIEFHRLQKIVDVGPTLVATIKDIEGNWIQFSQRK